jgi:hypothetical protein
MKLLTIISATILILGNINLHASDSLMYKIISLERRIMTAENNAQVAHLLLEKGIIYRRMELYADAIATLNRIPSGTQSDSLLCGIGYEKAFSYYMLGAYSNALDAMSGQNCITTAEAQILFLMILIENEQWDDFIQGYLEISEKNGITDTASVRKDLSDRSLADAQDYVRKASVPGRGLIKAGFVKDGVTSILLQVACVGFGAYEIYTGFYLTGIFSGIQPARRFYRGSKLLTQSRIEKKNADKIEALKKKGYSYIEKLYP